ncbi:HMA domain-containing protein [Trichonephila clavipes]|uniref:Copper transport protein ATOX1 n=2 Tax=Trichonephila TaxID=2585208 RepID=A0A8X6GC51_TRICU|nr:HMA domain-containing protein [Trichonephila clavata]GFV20423.1 HMA domain-containing protein [Trichonephila clavipes]GFY64652.1 HMA domain-containing protein [Trichonephila inaurata madagascariensis]
MSQTHEFTIEMTCEGCSGAVNRILERLKGSGVDDFSIDLGNKKVTVTSSLPAETLLETLKKCGKETTYVGVKA